MTTLVNSVPKGLNVHLDAGDLTVDTVNRKATLTKGPKEDGNSILVFEARHNPYRKEYAAEVYVAKRDHGFVSCTRALFGVNPHIATLASTPVGRYSKKTFLEFAEAALEAAAEEMTRLAAEFDVKV